MGEVDLKYILASVNFVFGIGCISSILIVLSIVPDCGSVLPSQFLTYLVIQSSVHLVVLFSTTLTMSFVMAIDPTVTESMDKFPGYLLIFGITVAGSLQLCNSFHRFLKIIAPVYCIRVYSTTFVFATIMGSFLLGANKFVNHLMGKRFLTFSTRHYRWTFNIPDDQRPFQITIIVILSILTILCLASVIRIFIDNFILLADRRYLNKKKVIKKIGSTFLFLVDDLIYGFLLLFATWSAQPTKKQQINNFYLILNIFQGYLQSFCLIIWPIFCSIIHYRRMRDAIHFRMRLMLAQEQMPERRRKISSKKISMVVNPTVEQNLDLENNVIFRQSTIEDFH